MQRAQMIVAFALMALVLPGATAQRAADLLSNLPPKGDLVVRHYFPEHAGLQFPGGDVISVVISGRNTGSKPMNLSAVVGSINAPENFDMYIQNFTVGRYLTPLAPGEEASIEYKFRADPILGATPARDLTVALHLLYETEGAYFSATVFNGTVGVAEARRLVDTDLLWLVVTLAALGAGGGYFAYSALSEKLGLPSAAKGKKGAKRAAAPAAIDEDEWVKGTAYDLAKRRKAAATRRA